MPSGSARWAVHSLSSPAVFLGPSTDLRNVSRDHPASLAAKPLSRKGLRVRLWVGQTPKESKSHTEEKGPRTQGRGHRQGSGGRRSEDGRPVCEGKRTPETHPPVLQTNSRSDMRVPASGRGTSDAGP